MRAVELWHEREQRRCAAGVEYVTRNPQRATFTIPAYSNDIPVGVGLGNVQEPAKLTWTDLPNDHMLVCAVRITS